MALAVGVAVAPAFDWAVDFFFVREPDDVESFSRAELDLAFFAGGAPEQEFKAQKN